MKQLNARILSNKKISKNYYLIRLDASYIARLSRPGQFIHVRCSESLKPLLRRPFSIHRVNSSAIDILYQVVGEGTEILSKKIPGQYLDIIGPLGRGFKISSQLTVDSSQTFVLVAGGIGVAPLLMLAQQIKQSQKKNNLVVLIGAKTKKEILGKKDFEKTGAKVKVATEDGSYGHKGMATALLEKLLFTLHPSLFTVIYACGPEKMLKKIKKISAKHRLKCQASLDRNMACGVGACLGCVIKTRDGYKRVCRDGPVFDLAQILW